MTLGIVGKKCGMTRVFTPDGVSCPVTVLHVEPNRIVGLRTVDTDGYRAVRVTTGARRVDRLSKAVAGQYAKAGVEPGRGLWEFRLNDGEGEELAVGSELPIDMFTAGQKVDAEGVSIGKGFAGVVKRYNFRTQDATHGNSLSHRAPGSIGQNQTPGRVFKGKKMAGHMGNARRTTQNLEVVRVDAGRGLILVKGAVPGATGGDVIIRPAVKAGA